MGNPGEFTMLELAERVVCLSGSKSKIEFRPLPSDDPRQRQPDIARAKALLDWQPSVALEDGLKSTIDYFRRMLSA
jgi:UDP-glucuronate decarboxylase